MFTCTHHNIGQAHNIKTDRKNFWNVANFKHSGTKVSYEIYIDEESKNRINSGIICYMLAQYLLISDLVSKEVQITSYMQVVWVWKVARMENIKNTYIILVIKFEKITCKTLQ